MSEIWESKVRNENVDSEELFCLTRKTKLIGGCRLPFCLSQQPAANVSLDMRSSHMLFSLNHMNITCLPSELLTESTSFCPIVRSGGGWGGFRDHGLPTLKLQPCPREQMTAPLMTESHRKMYAAHTS